MPQLTRLKAPIQESLAPPRFYKVVAIGGGTGLSTLLKGLKRYVPAPGKRGAHERGEAPRPGISDLVAVVTVTDDGGSSGRLRREFNILPPGDIRNCLVALSEDEALLSRLFQYRFSSGAGLEGHNFGNLFLTALSAITGDFAEAVREASQILATRGHIFPATTANVRLEALMDDGTRVKGETRITASQRTIVQLRMVPGHVHPLPQTLEAIRDADLITLGPGSLFTSLIPNVLVHGVPQAMAASPAVKVFICNLMTQANESLGLGAADHVRAIYEHARQPIFDYALLNSKPASPELKTKYATENAAPIEPEVEAVKALGVRCICGDFMEEAGGLARHATDLVASELLALLEREKRRAAECAHSLAPASRAP